MAESKLISRIYAWRVRAGLLAAVAALLFARTTPLSLLFGWIIALFGLFFRSWACGHLKKEKELATSGPYRYTRNPLYFGNFIIGIGIVVTSNTWWALAIFLVYFFIFYPVLILEEKNRMEKLFPQEYREYSRRVPLAFPGLRPPMPPADQKAFSWSLFRQNKEIRAILGILVYWLLMAGQNILF